MGSMKKTSNASCDSDSNGHHHRGLPSRSSHSKSRPPHKTKCKRRRSSSSSSSSSSSERESPPRRRPRSSTERKRERSSNRSRRRSSSSSSSDSSDSSTSDDERRRIAEKKKRAKKKRKKAEKKLKKQCKREARMAKSAAAAAAAAVAAECDSELEIGPPLPDSGVGQAMKPMTKEEWDKQRNEMRRVIDPETGRSRLIRGRGEILEEVVSQRRHQQINKQATQNDGANFQKEMAKRLVK